MGPSQFIPSTWENYQNRIANAVDTATPNPWNPKHAFMASGIYLANLGVDAGTNSAKRRAALKYYSGSNWQSPSVQLYGDQVMQREQNIQQKMIEPIEAAEQRYFCAARVAPPATVRSQSQGGSDPPTRHRKDHRKDS